MAKRQWVDKELAEILYAASNGSIVYGRRYITMQHYTVWRNAHPERNYPSAMTIRQRLGQGTWNDAFKRAEELMGSPAERRTTCQAKSVSHPAALQSCVCVRYTRIQQLCIEDIRWVCGQIGHQPTKRQYNKCRKTRGMQSVESIRAHFNWSWGKAMAAAGYSAEEAMGMPRSRKI